MLDQVIKQQQRESKVYNNMAAKNIKDKFALPNVWKQGWWFHHGASIEAHNSLYSPSDWIEVDNLSQNRNIS